MPQNFHALWYHLIWTTKHRERFITSSLKLPLYNKIRQICKEHDYYIDHINGTEDHVHLLIELKPKHCISDVVKTIKGLSWLWLRDGKLSKGYFSWQDGFAAISVSPSDLESVRRYIRNQVVYHKRKYFDEEMRILNPQS